jgi:predicted phosphoadenosine phosphosulfate sulfurtransferase
MNVLEAANDRLKRVFEEFDNVYVSFSGGKDSGVLLNLAVDYLRKHYPGRKLGVFHIDYEAQYQMTTDYVDTELSKNSDVLEVYRICLPISAGCATSMYKGYWTPWNADEKDLWVRAMPKNGITEANHEFEWFVKGMWDYDFQEKFSAWIHQKKNAKKTACLVGIRTENRSTVGVQSTVIRIRISMTNWPGHFKCPRMLSMPTQSSIGKLKISGLLTGK